VLSKLQISALSKIIQFSELVRSYKPQFESISKCIYCVRFRSHGMGYFQAVELLARCFNKLEMKRIFERSKFVCIKSKGFNLVIILLIDA